MFEKIVEKAMFAVSTAQGIVAMIIGAGASSAVAEVVKSWFPEQTATVADETIAAITGFLLFYYGDRVHSMLSSFGFGVFISAIGAWSSSFVATIFEALKKK